MKTLLLMLLLAPQLAAAGVYMCVDPATGKTSFTDRACDKSASREEVRVDPTNLGSGSRARGSVANTDTNAKKTWRSQQEYRKSGSDFTAQRRSLYENNATASVQDGAN